MTDPEPKQQGDSVLDDITLHPAVRGRSPGAHVHRVQQVMLCKQGTSFELPTQVFVNSSSFPRSAMYRYTSAN